MSFFCAAFFSYQVPNGVPKYYTRMSTEIFNIVNQLGQGKLTAEQAVDLMVEKVNALAKENN